MVEDQAGYSTHLITQNAVQFIERNTTQPFFLLVAHEAVRLPFQTPDDTPENRQPIPKSEQWSRERIRPKYKIMLEELAMGMDLLPTFAEMADVDLPADRRLDGTSIGGLLLRGEELPPRRVFFGYEPKLGTALRDGNWKMIVKSDKVELYDLSRDIGEKTNLANEQPERTEAMKLAIEAWKQEVAWE